MTHVLYKRQHKTILLLNNNGQSLCQWLHVDVITWKKCIT